MINGPIHSIALTQIINHPNGSIFHLRDGRLHREDGPAVIHPDGSRYWFLCGSHVFREQVEAHTQ